MYVCRMYGAYYMLELGKAYCLNWHVSVVSMYICGQSSWKPWLIACGVDISR